MATDVQIHQDIEELLQSIQEKSPVFKLILFNDDTHSMGQVVKQIIKAIKCDSARALQIMSEAHHNGQAIAKTGSKEECESAQRILEEIQLGTRLEEA